MSPLSSGQKVYEALKDDEKIVFMFMETGRSNDLFEEKQFGEFGEAAMLTVLVEEQDHSEIFDKIFQASGLDEKDQGIMFLNKRVTTDLPK
jgi:hypothetical protein